MEIEDLGDLFDAASKNYCSEDTCYLGTCPVNCLVYLVEEHLRKKMYFMLYGDYKQLKELAR